jgi:hypothetical protein
MMPARANLTDRAKRYRAQSAVRGARRCVLCGARGRLDVMHLDGNEANGDPRNLAYGCRSCNGKLAAAFKRIGAGVPTNQYNPRAGGIPTFGQYCWAVSQQRHSGEHGEAGAVIHATPKSKRIEYAGRIADIKRGERGNPVSRRNIWPFGAGQPLGTRTTHHRRGSRSVSSKAAQKQAREQEAERLERKLASRDLSAQLQRHYARGGTLAEFLQANPGLRPISKLYRKLENLVKKIGHETRTRKLNTLLNERQRIEGELARLGFPVNPGSGAFERCVEAVSEKGGAYDPRAVCAAAGRKKYGAKRFQEMARVGRERAARAGSHNPAYAIGDESGHTLAGFDTQAAAFREARSLAQSGQRVEVVWQTQKGYQSKWFVPKRKNLVDPTVAAMIGSEFSKLGAKLRKKAGRNPSDAEVWRDRAAAALDLTHRIGERGPKTFQARERVAAWLDIGGRVPKADIQWLEKVSKRANPAEAAAEMSERFHGRPVTEVLDIEEQVHYHEHLAELGELERLKVKALDGGIVTLTQFDGAILCSNEDGSQLYIRGGDQAVDPASFAVEKPYHDKEDLGEVVKIWYFTTKEHLGDQGGTASYHHEFGEEDRERGTRPRRPRLEYSTRDQRLSFSGGAYAVEPEGIRN